MRRRGNRTIRKYASVLTVGAIISACSAGSAPQTWPTGTDVTVGIVPDAPGLEVNPITSTGFEISLMDNVASSLDIITTTHPETAAERQPDLQNHIVDIVIGAYSITPQRNAQGVDFAGPYLVTKDAFLVKSTDNSFANAGAVAGKHICVVTDTTGETTVQTGFPGTTTFTTRDTSQECVDALHDGTVDEIGRASCRERVFALV